MRHEIDLPGTASQVRVSAHDADPDELAEYAERYGVEIEVKRHVHAVTPVITYEPAPDVEVTVFGEEIELPEELKLTGKELVAEERRRRRERRRKRS